MSFLKWWCFGIACIMYIISQFARSSAITVSAIFILLLALYYQQEEDK